MFVLTLSFWTMRHPKCRCSGIASYQGRFVPNAGLILSGAKSKISPDVRHAATAVLMSLFSAGIDAECRTNHQKGTSKEFLQLTLWSLRAMFFHHLTRVLSSRIGGDPGIKLTRTG